MQTLSCSGGLTLENADLIFRITQMEQYFDILAQADPRTIGANPQLSNMLSLLTEYYEKGQWQADYEADEQGQIPQDLKRGVLSQDGLWNLLQRIGSSSPDRKNEAANIRRNFHEC